MQARDQADRAVTVRVADAGLRDAAGDPIPAAMVRERSDAPALRLRGLVAALPSLHRRRGQILKEGGQWGAAADDVRKGGKAGVVGPVGAAGGCIKADQVRSLGNGVTA